MTSKNSTTWASYDFESAKYFENYSKLYFSNVHRQFIKFLPKSANAKILDIGCGSGRDALSLARRGYQLTAVEPSTKMLELAKAKNNHKNIRWLNDSLPHLSVLHENTYDFILLSAVWMHIAPEEREASIKRMSELLNRDGHLAITLRIGAPDPLRMMYPIFTNDLLTQSKKAGLTLVYSSRETKDSLKRDEVKWKKVVLKKE